MKLIFRKNIYYFLLLLIFSCSKNDKSVTVDNTLTCFDGILNGNEITIDCGGDCPGFCPSESIGILEGELVIQTQLNPNKEYRLTGSYIIRDKAALTIPAGTVIKADPGKGAYIAVAQGGRLYANGQPDNPVIITSGSPNPKPGDWGGIVICGKAPINTGNVERSDNIDIFYGGSKTNDTSGVFNYLRIEYAGAQINERKFDAIAFYGVGSITTVTRLQSFYCQGNGIRFIGGNVNTKWLVSTNSGENAIAMTNDWSGKGEFWHLSGSSKAGIKITSNIENSVTMAVDSLKNISILGPSMNGGIDYSSGNGAFTFANLYSSNLSTGIKVNDSVVNSNIDIGNFRIDSIEFDKPNANFIATNYAGSNPNFYFEAESDGSGNKAVKPDWAIGWTRGLD